MSKDGKPLVESPQPFHILINRIESGGFSAELTDQLNDLNGELALRAAQDGKAKGSLTITLNFTFERSGIVEVQGEVKTKTPKANREKTHFWVTEGNNLSLENPRQPQLPLRAVENPETPAREVPGSEGTPRTLGTPSKS